MTDRFHHEDDIRAAYEAAEQELITAFMQYEITLSDNPFKEQRLIRELARRVADAVIRSDVSNGDITDIPGVDALPMTSG